MMAHLNDRQILQDVQELQEHLQSTIRSLIDECNQLFKDSQTEHGQMQSLVIQCKQITQDIEQVREVRKILENIGGIATFQEVRHLLKSAESYLSLYENSHVSLQADLDRYSSLSIQTEIDKLEQLILRCENFKDDERKAAKQFEDLRNLYGELLQAQKLLNERGIEGFSGYFNFLDKTLRTIEQQRQDLFQLWEKIKLTESRTETLLNQANEPLQPFNTLLNNLTERLEGLDLRLNDQYHNMSKSVQKLRNELEIYIGERDSQEIKNLSDFSKRYDDQMKLFSQDSSKINDRIKSIEQQVKDVLTLGSDVKKLQIPAANNEQSRQIQEVKLEIKSIRATQSKLHRQFWLNGLIAFIGGVILSVSINSYVSLCWLVTNSNSAICGTSGQLIEPKSHK